MRSRLTRILQISFVQTALALFGARFVSYLLPLITVPYLARVLGPADWGQVVFAQAIGLYLVLIIEFSFLISATREVARERAEPDKLGQIVSGVLGAKILLVIACAVLIGLLQLVVPAIRESGMFAWLALFWALGFAMVPMFYFQGIEKVHRMLRVDIPIRVVSTALIFLLVKSSDDAWLVLFLQGAGGILIVVASSIVMYRDVPFVRPNVRESYATLRSGLQLFGGRISSSLFWMSNPIILGIVAPVQSVSFYAGAERIMKAVTYITEPVTSALLPHSSNLAKSDPARLSRVATVTMAVMFTWSLVVAGILYIGAPLAIRILLGPGYEASVDVLRILILAMPIMGISLPLIMQWMVPLGMDRTIFWIALAAGLGHLPIAVFLGMRYAQTGVATAYVITEVCSLTITLVVLFRKNALPGLRSIPNRPAHSMQEPGELADTVMRQ